MRADEHEGELNDTEVKRMGDRAKKHAGKVIAADLLTLTESPEFLRWFQRYAYPAITQDFPVNGGSNLAEFMGRRQLVLEIVREMDGVAPGFLRRLLESRDRFESDMLGYAQQKEK